MSAFIGRASEIQQLRNIVNSDKAEFLAIYGRRRVGKTFMVKSFFNNKFTFYATGLANEHTSDQLQNFVNFINTSFKKKYAAPLNWRLAFDLLKIELSKIKGQKIIFIDEMPWMDTKKSDFITGLELFWNSWASSQKNLKLIVCGSAASWMINKLISNTKGLYNRVTARMKVQPFTLHEFELYFDKKNLKFDRYQLVQLYMIMGGIPFYMDQVKKGSSIFQTIDQLCFEESGLLKSEFKLIFDSLFSSSGKHETIIRAIYGLGGHATREEIARKTRIETSGDFSQKLKELEESGFIKSYIPYGLKSNSKIFKISDYYTLFYFRFIENSRSNYYGGWLSRLDDTAVRVWQGLAFEQICWDHIDSLRSKLGIMGVYAEVSPWRQIGSKSKKGSQIDLVIDRKDRVINLCEIKFYNSLFTITKDYDMKLKNKVEVFRQESNTRKSVFITMITTFGLTQNQYAKSSIQNEVSLDDLFQS
jgi:uncharacterized protein